jgi:hypothetical protein
VECTASILNVEVRAVTMWPRYVLKVTWVVVTRNYGDMRGDKTLKMENIYYSEGLVNI